MEKITANTIHELIEKAKDYKWNTHYFFEQDGWFYLCIYKEFHKYIIENKIYEWICLISDVDSIINNKEEENEKILINTEIKENKEKDIEWITEEHIDIMMSWYNSKNIFWPEMRSVLEKIIINYDPSCQKQKRALNCMLDDIIDLIPCDECSEHYEKQVEEKKPPIHSRLEMLEWLIDLHDNVNEWNWKSRLWWKQWLKSISERIEKQLLDSELKKKPSN